MASRSSAQALTVNAPDTALAGSTINVSISGLKRGEKVTVTIAGVLLATGKAPWFGPAKLKVSLGGTAGGPQTIVATGLTAARTGSRSIEILTSHGGTSSLTKRI